jgi:type VI secretion system secreted protein VgrG
MLEIATTLGAGTFTVQSFSGREELGRLFEYNVELLSEKGDITAEKLLGTNATVALELPGGMLRNFNGYLTRFTVQGQTSTPAFKSGTGYLYLATISPGLWMRTRASNSQIFAKQTIADLLSSELPKGNLMTLDAQVGATELRDYVVQYRETDFNFLSRMMEHAGVYYFFTHVDGAHSMTLIDDAGKHKTNPLLATLSFTGATLADVSVDSLQFVSEVQPGAYSTGDYNYVTPNTQIAAVTSQPKSHDNAGFEIFDFPTDTTTSSFASTYAQIRADELGCRYAVAHGTGTERRIQVGFKITVANHSSAVMNREFLVIGHAFEATNNLAQSAGGAGSSFQCTFEAIPSSVQFRPARVSPRPIIAGTQTALVVADFRTDTDSSGGADPIGANIGRVKVQFYWDRYGKQSCWARVSTPWAGKGYGFQNMPRIGEEVLVQFLEGDPDRPVVIGRVHNAENMPPFKLPASAPFTGLKTLSIDASGNSVAGKWNELRFDDTSGAEQIYLQAQFNLDKRILNDEKTWVGNESHHYVKADTFDKFDADHHVDTTGDHNEKIGGALSFDVTSDIHVKSGTKALVDAGSEVHIKAGAKIVLEASSMVSLVVGGNFITIDASGVSIKGTMVNVNSGGAAGSGTAAAPHAVKPYKAAMTSEGGTPLTKPAAPTPPTAFSPQASSFLVAASTAAPFVAPCAG